MRIVHLAKFYPPDSGGMESVTQTLVQKAVAEDHTVEVVCFSWHQHGQELRDGAQVHRTPINLHKASQPLSWLYALKSLRRGRRADIVHVHTPNLLASLITLLMRRSTKLVVHWHSDIVGKGLLNILVKPLELAMLARADAIIATSDAYLEGSRHLQRFRRKVHVIPIGVPTPQTETSPSASVVDSMSGLNHVIQNKRLVLALGRQVPYKGFFYLIDAAPYLPDDVVIVIGGTGPLHESLKARVEAQSLQDRVWLPGQLTNEQVEALFREACLFCLPSIERSEAFGVVLLEAMARGVPCVATKILGSATSWINQDRITGLNVEPANAQALAEAIKTITQSPQRRANMSHAALARYREHFTDERFGLNVSALYARLLGISD